MSDLLAKIKHAIKEDITVSNATLENIAEEWYHEIDRLIDEKHIYRVGFENGLHYAEVVITRENLDVNRYNFNKIGDILKDKIGGLDALEIEIFQRIPGVYKVHVIMYMKEV